jgi:hypothetical protein
MFPLTTYNARVRDLQPNEVNQIALGVIVAGDQIVGIPQWIFPKLDIPGHSCSINVLFKIFIKFNHYL